MGGTETPASILRFWFGDDPGRSASDPAGARLWWSKQPEVDAAMRERFGPWVEKAGAGALDAWAAQPEGRLALILLADQFTRNIHRGTPAAFSLDPQAQAWCEQGWAEHAFDTLAPAQRLFACMPLEHAESLPHQDRAVALIRALRDSLPPAEQPGFDGFVDFAERHREVIRRFGRFPHRNAVLGRPSTPDELAFLRTPGSAF
jgi:uncharacterized protein (DUF924 family)